MKIPIKEAINSGSWFKCQVVTYLHYYPDHRHDDEFNFRLRILSFDRINLDEVDDPARMDMMDLYEGILWLLKFEVVNLFKKELSPWYVLDSVRVIDRDGFEFQASNDSHLTYDSNYAKITKLDRFHDITGNPPLIPKVKTSGALAFLLPDEENAEYHISVVGGNIQEV